MFFILLFLLVLGAIEADTFLIWCFLLLAFSDNPYKEGKNKPQ